jgi:hypothetical protein
LRVFVNLRALSALVKVVTMKYKVGDKVLIHSLDSLRKPCYIDNRGNIWENKGCKEYCISLKMHQYLGKQAIIKYIRSDFYDLDIDNRAYCWEDWMLEDNKE